MNMACKPLFVDFQLILRDFKIIYKEIDVLNVKIFTGRYSGLISYLKTVWKRFRFYRFSWSNLNLNFELAEQNANCINSSFIFLPNVKLN